MLIPSKGSGIIVSSKELRRMSCSANLPSIKWHPTSGMADPALRDHQSNTVINAVCFAKILDFYPVKQEFLNACIIF